MATPGAPATVEVLEHDAGRVERLIPQVRVDGLDIDVDAERSRFVRLGSRTFALAFNRAFFGKGTDFEHLRGRRTLVAVLAQAMPTDPGRFEAHRLIVADLRRAGAERLEVRRLDGSVSHTGSVRIEQARLSTSMSMDLPKVPLAGTIAGGITAGGEIRLERASLSLRTTPSNPAADARPG